VVDGAGLQRYSPVNLQVPDESYTKPTQLERDLIARIRATHAAEIPKRCPMTQANQPCQCVAARAAAAASAS
jgi:hypothetical protein